MNISGWLPFTTFGNSISILNASLLGGYVFRICPASPGPLSASFDIISSLCSDPLLRHHTHQYAHRPIGCARFLAFGRYRSDTVFIRRRIVSGFLHVWNLTFLLPRSACIVSNVSRMKFTRIASSKVPFLTISEADRAFQAVRFFDVELAHFYSYHLDRFGYSAAASPANE